MGDTPGIDVSVPPSGTGCLECEAGGGWWLHLRRCAQCGHIGCCDNSPSRHATGHARSTGHPVIRSFEPGEDWFWDYRSSTYFDGPELASPRRIIRRTKRPPDPPHACLTTGRTSCTDTWGSGGLRRGLLGDGFRTPASASRRRLRHCARSLSVLSWALRDG